jgi:hypothetical protein
MTGIFAAHLGGIVADAFDQEPAAGHLTMFARRRRASLGDNTCDRWCAHEDPT